MKHIMGNTPRCDECYFYTAKSEHEKDNWLDGWGFCPHCGARMDEKKNNG